VNFINTNIYIYVRSLIENYFIFPRFKYQNEPEYLSIQRMVMGWTAGVQFPREVDFSLLRSVRTVSGAHPTSSPMSTGGSFLAKKWPGYEADHSSPFSAQVNNGGATL
jgi:hypothetical protein